MHIMIDLETMGTSPSAAIVAIGAVIFDEHTLRDQFYANVDLQSAIDSGATVDGSTVMWWLKQSDAARAAITDPETTRPIREALEDFAAFTRLAAQHGLEGVWGNGASFDNVLLAESYRRLGMDRPWPFWLDRCYRTMKNLHTSVPVDHTGVAHNALDDAVAQAMHLQRMWRLY